MLGMAIDNDKLRETFVKAIQVDISSQLKQHQSCFFVDKEVYDICFTYFKDTVDEASLSKFFLRYHPDVSPNDMKSLFCPSFSPGNRLAMLRSIGGETYGYHLLYMAIKEDDKDTPSRRIALKELEDTAKRLGKQPPQDLLKSSEVISISSAVTGLSLGDEEPLGEDQSMKQNGSIHEEPPVHVPSPSRSLDSHVTPVKHHRDCKCGFCPSVIKRLISAPGKLTEPTSPDSGSSVHPSVHMEIGEQDHHLKESFVTPSPYLLGNRPVLPATTTKHCVVNTESNPTSPPYAGDSVSGGALGYLTTPKETESVSKDYPIVINEEDEDGDIRPVESEESSQSIPVTTEFTVDTSIHQ